MATDTLVRRMHAAAPPIGRHKETMVIAFATNATTITADVGLNGTILHAYIVAPALDVGTQFTFSIEDEDGDEIYTSGLLDENGTRNLDPGLSVCGTITLKIVTAGSQTANETFVVKLVYS